MQENSSVKIHCKYDKFVEVDKLVAHPKNRNKHPDEQIERLCLLISNHGVRAPIIVSLRSGYIVKGHGTLKAEIKLGMKEVPVVYQDFESDEEEYQFLQADNAIASWAFLDLSQIHVDIAELGPFDLDLLGVKNFDLAPNIAEINKGDENSEWVGMPEFEEGSGYIKLTYLFGSEEARQKFVEENSIVVGKKQNNQWIVYK